MRISDWSSDVCSSDLVEPANHPPNPALFLDVKPCRGRSRRLTKGGAWCGASGELADDLSNLRTSDRRRLRPLTQGTKVIGSASCRVRVCQYVSISVAAAPLQNTTYQSDN